MLTPAPGSTPPTIEELRARVSARLDWVPRCRRRLMTAPFGLGGPHWVDHPCFAVTDHVVELGEPGETITPRRFAQLRDELLSAPLDRSRPLWHLAIALRLSDGRMAMVGRVHHALADGAAALQVAMLILDIDGVSDAAPAPWLPARTAGRLRRALDPVVQGAELTAGMARGVVRGCERPRATAAAALRDAGRVAQALAEDLLPRAPLAALNAPLGPRRTLVQHRVPLARLSAITRGRPATRNDAATAAIAGALRALALERGAPTAPLKALVPVNMRRASELGTLGNRVSLTAVWLPLDAAAPRDRLERVQRQTARFKANARPQGMQTAIAGFGLLPNALRAPVLRAAAPGRFNLIISSVPGPPTTLTMFGARMDEVYPVIPMTEGQVVSIGMVAYDEHLHFGLIADPDALPRPERLAELIDAELDALARLHRPSAPLPTVAPVAAGPLGTYENRSAVLAVAGPGGHA